MDSNMEEEEMLERSVEDAIATKASNVSLASLDLFDIPIRVFTTLQSKANVMILSLEYNDLVSLHDEIGLLTSLEELHLTGNKLDGLPDTIGDLANLRLLNLNENNLEELPDTINKLQNLQVLNVVGNRLETFPEKSGFGLRSLIELRADENMLQHLPESFSCLSKLRVLELSDNRLTRLPDNVGDLQDLSILNVSQNNIKELPESFSELRCLTSLDIADNHMKFLPNQLKSAEVLQYLYAANNLFLSLPCWFEKLFSIVEINLSNNELGDMALPGTLGIVSGKTLVSLDLSGNKMTALPESIGELHKLEFLHLGSTICELERRAFQNGNWLPCLPESFGEMSALTTLHLDENQLEYLPETFGDLTSLEWFDAGQNRISKLPKSFCSLKNLWFLQLSKNNLERLPEDFGQLCSLVELRLDSNSLTTLPESFVKLQNLELLDLFCNHLTEIPKVLLQLQKLKRLDLDNNKLKIKEDKVPKLINNVQYAPRNPNHDNWRGKLREDKCESSSNLCQTSLTNLIENAESEDKEDDNVLVEECTYNERALEMAMKRGLSIWRSHTGPQTREETVGYSQRGESFRFVPQEEDTMNEIFEDATEQDGQTECLPSTPTDLQCQIDALQLVSEDWDQETEEGLQEEYKYFQGSKKTQLQISSIRGQLQDILYSYPPAQQAYTKSAMYESIYRRALPCTNATTTIQDEVGQFDDADDCSI